MNYDDESNLYHYSYRKSGTDPVEPVYTKNYAEEPAEGKKSGRLGLKITALALVCALIGGTVGAGATAYLGASMRGAAPTEDAAVRGTEQPAAETAEKPTLQVSDRETNTLLSIKVDKSRQLTMPEVYAANVNSVVSINTTITRNVFNQVVENAASGSGFLITSDGYILTNYHVVENASQVKVTLYSGESYDAAIIGGDEDYDIAVLKIAASDLPAVTLGDSSKLLIGETIAAIGNPLGELTFSMSQGIVSCVDRAINVDGTPFNMIQVDCSINPGNSGGPLVNTYGEVVGIVSAKYSSYSTTTVEGIGFAIPINDVIAMVEDIMENGRVTNRPYLAIMAADVTARRAQQNGYGVSEGVLISSLEEGGAAERAGLRAGDIIIELDGKTVSSLSDLNAAKKGHFAGETVPVTVYRDGEEVTVQLTFDAVPEQNETKNEQQEQNNSDYYNGNYGNYTNPWDFFNDFFRGYGYGYGNGYGN